MTMPEIIQLQRKAKAANDRYRQDEAKLYDRRGFPASHARSTMPASRTSEQSETRCCAR